MIYHNGKIKYLERHLQRLFMGMNLFGMIPNHHLNFSSIDQQVHQLVKLNKLTDPSRVRLQVWRKSGGLYTPLNNEIDFFIKVQEQIPLSGTGKTAEISQEIKVNFNIYSRFKTCNMLIYILASLEKEKRKLDDLILLNSLGFVAECTAANIFWVKNNIFYTPALESGCIEGIMRGVILDMLKIKKINSKEVLEGPDALYSADYAFTCNVAGVIPLEKIDNKTYSYRNEQFLSDL
jgi:4-amino-4-deoxychorismate lyase